MSEFSPLQRFLTRFSGGFVLAFHEIPPERVAGFVDCIRPGEAVPLSELVQRSKQHRVTSGLFAITVDDGVGENVRDLAGLFRARGWPATFYLPTRYLETREGMAFQWWRRLKPLLPRRSLEVKSGTLDLSRRGAVDELSKKMEVLWNSQRLESYFSIIMDLAEIVMRESGMTMAELQPAAPITWSEVAELGKNDLIRFESHGVSHAAMSALTEEEVVFEMQHSRDVVTERTGRPCRHLAYPFGSWQSIGAHAPGIAARFYDSAVTMSLGHVDFANPWLLPRIPLYAENSMQLARLKILLKCSNVSPLRSARAAK